MRLPGHLERVALQATETALLAPVLATVRQPNSGGTSQPVSVLFGDPVAVLILLVLLLYGAPGDAVGAILFSVLLLCGVKCLFVDLLGVLGKIILYTIWQLRDLLVGHLAPRVQLPSTTLFFTLEGI